MLGKIPAAGRGFKGVVSYLLRGRPGKEPHQGPSAERRDATPRRSNRVLFVATENLLTNDPETAARIMRATANRSRRCKAPVYHFVISWRNEDRPDFATMRAIVDDACEGLGMEGLQRLAIGHDDTRHRHVHVVVNRIHPETGKAWNRRQDWVRLENVLAQLADHYGYARVHGRHNAPRQFGDAPAKAPDREYQLARRTGAPTPMMKWPRGRVLAERANLAALFDQSRSWEDVHRRLAGLGYRLEAKGAGLVIRDAASELKLSLVSKEVRLNLLQKRFGAPFTPAPLLPAPEPEPIVPRNDFDVRIQAAPCAPAEPPAGPAPTPHAPDLDPVRGHDDDDDDDSPRRRRTRTR